MTLPVTVFTVKAFYCIVFERTKSKITQNIKMQLSTCTVSHFPTKKKVFLYRLAHSFNGYILRVTLTATVFIVKVFYCIVFERTKSKITQNIKMQLSTCTVSHFPTKKKVFLYRLAHSFNGYILRVTLTATVFIVKVFYCLVFERTKSKLNQNIKMRPGTCTVPFSNTNKVFLHRLAHFFNGYVFRVTLTVTVFLVKAFYCVVFEQIKSKITHNIKMRPGTCTVSHFPTLIKSVPS